MTQAITIFAVGFFEALMAIVVIDIVITIAVNFIEE